MSNPDSFVGIDVAKAWLDVAWLDGRMLRIERTTEAIAGLLEQVRAQPPALVVMEATGGLETELASALAVARVPVAAVNPRQVRDYAKACGRLAKIDRIDALVLAAFAQAIRPQVRELLSGSGCGSWPPRTRCTAPARWMSSARRRSCVQSDGSWMYSRHRLSLRPLRPPERPL